MSMSNTNAMDYPSKYDLDLDLHMDEDEDELAFPMPLCSGNLPLWFSQGHIRDDIAKDFQAQLSPTSSIKFLSTLQKPKIGMRTYTSIYALDGTALCLAGTVTSVGDEPSTEELSQSDSLLWGLLSENPTATVFQAKTPQDKKTFISNFVGCVHGQRITSIASLEGAEGEHLLHNAQVEIVYKFNDNMYYPWVVESFSILPTPTPESFAEAETRAPKNQAEATVFDVMKDDELKCPNTAQLSSSSPNTTMLMEGVAMTTTTDVMDKHHSIDHDPYDNDSGDIFRHLDMDDPQDFYNI